MKSRTVHSCSARTSGQPGSSGAPPATIAAAVSQPSAEQHGLAQLLRRLSERAAQLEASSCTVAMGDVGQLPEAAALQAAELLHWAASFAPSLCAAPAAAQQLASCTLAVRVRTPVTCRSITTWSGSGTKLGICSEMGLGCRSLYEHISLACNYNSCRLEGRHCCLQVEVAAVDVTSSGNSGLSQTSSQAGLLMAARHLLAAVMASAAGSAAAAAALWSLDGGAAIAWFRSILHLGQGGPI